MTLRSAQIPLESGWRFRKVGEDQFFDAAIPGCVHTDLYRNGLIPDPFWGTNEARLQWIEEEDWEYALDFHISEELLASQHVDLFAEGLDTLATVSLNGVIIAETQNMFVPIRCDVKSLLKAGQNELLIHFRNPMIYLRACEGGALTPVACDPIGGRQYIRKQQCSFGWDWGPRFATSGIWRPIRIEAWEDCRLDGHRVSQMHKDDKVVVTIEPELAGSIENCSVRAQLAYEGETVVEISATAGEPLELSVDDPKIWFPNGHGDQPVYTLKIELLSRGDVIEERNQLLGLCDARLDRHDDEWGESFQFVVNGIPVFAKGANWIPAHSFVNEGKDLAMDALESAKAANMNMIRVWGGGIYEDDAFYEQCLKLGLMVWQDFMFACWTYPGDENFLETVEDEATAQVRRLRNFSNLVLLCGNNEIVQMHWERMRDDPQLTEDYEALFHDLLPKVVEKHAPNLAYWPTSGWNPQDPMGFPDNPESGDTHYWGVWHARQPVEAYEKLEHRFFSEFGMQSYPWPETAATFTKSTNLYSPEMDNHQKNGGGNETIFHYLSTLYRFPKDYPSQVYLSQLNQAYCLRFGIEHMRRNMPRTMGALYWQLNDCWPVASWSSLDFGGRWKVLHYAARRFFAPLLVSVKRLGEESVYVSNNYRNSTIDKMEIHAVFDGPKETKGVLEWTLWSVSQNRVLLSGTQSLTLTPGHPSVVDTIDASEQIKSYGRDDLVLRTRLSALGYEASENTTFFSAPRRLEFKRPELTLNMKQLDGRRVEVTVSCDVIAYQVFFKLSSGHDFRASDNAFDLFPGEEKSVIIEVCSDELEHDFTSALESLSYFDTYDH
ncbi:beta-mannosidase [Cerasicoccus arenae]|uniref:beta-mannosidase n=1 Tax=Cerasicoccus arenae TaxID=424488 RepID=A0A8J3DA12_9BACT|nr:glycoside hydrolase family 2 protein [Cerasicoccus arenae]MBK1857275.1 glycoside hydrolase family 2 protein [Cerasicoccus arenae]GHC00412.1 beta-mannosidase [Cerasicoccus arenae]